jgi:8-oxo-dGTP pyrophosphatase MutT (NUDIX family)
MLKVPSSQFANSSFAIIEINNSLLMQCRDSKKKIWYPSMLGLFGGQIEKNENRLMALRREIKEETNLLIKSFLFLNSFKIKVKNKYYNRYVYSCKIDCLPKTFKVNEGVGFKLIPKEKLHKYKKLIIPTDYVSISNYLRVNHNHYLL